MWLPDSGIEGRYRAETGAIRLYVTPTGGTYTWWIVSASSFSESGTAIDLATAKSRAIEAAERHIRETRLRLRLLEAQG